MKVNNKNPVAIAVIVALAMLFILVNPMCKFFKQPTDPIEAEEPDLAN